jgi:hypothetical protein
MFKIIIVVWSSLLVLIICLIDNRTPEEGWDASSLQDGENGIRKE